MGRVVALAFLAGIALSPRLWLSESRDFPLVPVSPWLLAVGAPLDTLLLAALVLGLVAVAVLPRSRPAVVATVVAAVLLGLLDQQRWQPWAYQYLLMLVALALPSGRRDLDATAPSVPALAVCGFIVVATYFWSGLSKLGPAFRLEVFPFLLEPLLGELPAAVEPGAFAVPVIETGVALGLVWPRTRPYAVVGALLMHTFILLSIGPLGRGWNSVVWPWNIAMMVLVVAIFWRLPTGFGRSELKAVRGWGRSTRAFAVAVAVLVGLMPALNFVGRWDSYLSAELYSGAILRATIVPSGALVHRLPRSAQRALVPSDRGAVLPLSAWAMSDLNVPAYPARRVYLSVARRLCERTGGRHGLTLIIGERAHLITGRRRITSYRCEELSRWARWAMPAERAAH